MEKPQDPRPRRARAATSISPEGWVWLADRYQWSQRETQVAQLLVAGMELKIIARQLGIRETTVRTHVGELYRKTGEHSRGRFANKVVSRYLEMLQQADVEPTPPPLTEHLRIIRREDCIRTFSGYSGGAIRHGLDSLAHPAAKDGGSANGRHRQFTL